MAKSTVRDADRAPLGSPKTFRIGRRRYAVGLFWQVADSSKTIRREARGVAQETGINADLHIRRIVTSTGTGQFALARSRDGVARAAVAAAAAMADQVPQRSWVGVFPLTSGYWYVRIRDGLVMPDGDDFLDSEEVARQRLHDDVNDGGWERIFAPEGWDANADTLAFEKLLAKATGPQLVDLNPVKANRSAIALAALGVVAVVAGWQGYDYYQYLQAQERIADARKDRLKDRIAEPAPKLEIPAPWHSVPSAHDALTSCADTMAEINTNAPGFALRAAVCNGRTVTFAWDRLGRANIDWIERWLARQGDYEIRTGQNGERVTFQLPVDRADARDPRTLLPAREVLSGLIKLRQATNTKFIAGKVGRWQPPRGRYDPERYKRPDYASMPVEIQISSLESWLPLLGDIPGFVVNTLIWDQGTKTFTINGEIYVES